MTSIDNRKAVARAAAECHAISLDEDAGDFCATRVQYCDARAIAGLQCQSFVHFDHAAAACWSCFLSWPAKAAVTVEITVTARPNHNRVTNGGIDNRPTDGATRSLLGPAGVAVNAVVGDIQRRRIHRRRRNAKKRCDEHEGNAPHAAPP